MDTTEESWKNETEAHLKSLVQSIRQGGENRTLTLTFQLSQRSKEYLTRVVKAQGFIAMWSHIEGVGDTCTLDPFIL